MEEKIAKLTEYIIKWVFIHGVKVVFILVVAYFLNKFMQKFIRQVIRRAVVPDNYSSLDDEKKREDTLIQTSSVALKLIIYVVAALMVIQEFGVQIGPIFAAAGIAGVAVGFGAQYLIRDIITGLFIILENQYRIGDVINLEGTSGVVESISLRKTTLRDMDGTLHHIPHGEIKKVSNLTKDYSRINLNIGISYNAELEHVISVVNKVGNDLAEDPQWSESIVKAPQFLRVNDFADSAIIIKITGETKALKQWEVAGELRKRIKIAFDNEGIEIPFPQMVIHQAK
jgi:moderate conductance mechanosensitive channel